MSYFPKRSGRTIATFVLCMLLLFLFLRDTDVCFSEMRRGLSICAGVLVPTLFPYMMISEMLVRADLGYYLATSLGKPMRRIFGVSGGGAGALLLGIVCGFPIGAKTAAALYSRGELTADEYGRLLGFCNYPSAPFVIFAVGKHLLGNAALGAFIYLVNLMTGIIFGLFTKGKRISDNVSQALPKKSTQPPFFKLFTDSAASASGAVISVCSLVTLFTCAIGCLSALDFINNAPILKALIFSLFELTSGAAACAALPDRSLAAVMSAGAVGWSGISVLMQIYSACITPNGVPSLLPYLKSRLISSAVCSISTWIAILTFPALTPTEIPDTDVFLELTAYPSALTFLINLLFLASVAFYSNKKLDIRRRI